MTDQSINNTVVAKFKSTGCHKVCLSGKEYPVYFVENDKQRDRGDDGLKGNTVEIDGQLYKVVGVESYATPFIRKGHPIGLAVEKVMDKLIGQYTVTMDGNDERYVMPSKQAILNQAKNDGVQISHFVESKEEYTGKYLIAGVVQ